MTEEDPAAKAAAKIERTRAQIRGISENPDITKSAVGTVVLDLIRAGEEVSLSSILGQLEMIAAGASSRSGLNDLLARGALRVISDLRDRSAG